MLWTVLGIGIGVVSLILNLVQYLRDRYKYKPIYNSLLGMFNQIRLDTQSLTTHRQILIDENNPHNDFQALLWDYAQFIDRIINSYSGMREHIVSALKAINESEQKIFRAQEFGLTNAEKENADQFARHWKEKKEQEHKLYIARLKNQLCELTENARNNNDKELDNEENEGS